MRTLVTQWADRLALTSDDPAKQELLELFERAYNDLVTTSPAAPPWESVRQVLRDEVIGTETWMVNSLPAGRDPVGTPFRLPNNILIGGNMLGRGVTVEGLAVTYITRRATRDTNADTMEQRARWFGYKEGYLDVCRIYLTSQLRDDYTQLLQHEDDFWDALDRTHRQGLSVRDWPRLLRLNVATGVRPTRTNVASFRQFRPEGWYVQNRLVEEESRASSNVGVARGFFERRPTEARTFGNVTHLVLERCPTEELISDLLARVDTVGTDWESTYVVEYLARLVVGGRLPSLDVLLMVEGRARERAKSGGRVNPMQGRSPGRAPADPQYYPGDDNLHGGAPQLQVHIIQMRGGEVTQEVTTTAFALYIPQNDTRFDLRYVVRDPQ
ncbi:MAG: Z1 domain-containing protein [Dehalococcoidia bacterium]